MPAMPPLWSVVLNWKKPDMTSACVRALLASSYPNHFIVIVDNGSGDGSAEKLRTAFPNLTVIANEHNLGFSRGCNVGVRHALEHGAGYVALVNNDLIMEPGGYDAAVREFGRSPRTGAVTGKIFTADGKTLWQAGGHISHLKVSGVARGHFEPDRGQYDSPGLTGWASGAMSVFSADALRKVGLLPEEYFFGQEEWDISTNLLNNGFEIAYVPTFIGRHAHGGSYRPHPILNDYGGTRNRLLYADKYIPTLWRLPWKAALWMHLRVVMPGKLRRMSGEHARDIGTRVKAMQLAFSKHTAGTPVTLEEFRAVSRELGVADSWAPDRP